MSGQSQAVPASAAIPGTPVAHRPTVAVVVNFNGGAALAECVRQLAALLSGGLLTQFVILDNGSTDGSFQPSEISLLGGTPVHTGRNVGFAAAVNRGIRTATGSDVLLLNPDAVITADGLVAMQNELHRESRVCAVGGILRREDGTFQPSLFPEPTVLWAIAHLLRLKDASIFRRIAQSGVVPARSAGVYLASAPGPSRNGDWLNGACVLLRREAISEVGEFDERFFLYFEEIDWCRRARACGWTIRFVAAEAAVHLIGRSAETVPALATYARYASMVAYFRKHHGGASASIVRVVGASACLIRLLARGGDPVVERAALRAFLSR